MKAAIVVLATALLWTVNKAAYAQPDSAPASAALMNYAIFQNLDRRALARLISNYCSEVLQIIPRNTPREDDWAESEMQSGNWDRMTRAAESVEMIRKSMVSSFSECASFSTQLIRGSQPSAEAVLWTRLAMTFSHAMVSQNAERLGLVKYDQKAGWVDPHHLKALPISIVFQAHVAVIESLGQKVNP